MIIPYRPRNFGKINDRNGSDVSTAFSVEFIEIIHNSDLTD